MPRISKAEKIMRVRKVRLSILARRDRASILAAAAREWNLREEQADWYIAQARDEIAAEVAHDHPEQLAQAIATLDDIFSKLYHDEDWRGCLMVQHEINDMLGLHAAKRHEITGKGGGPVQVQAVQDLSMLSDEDFEHLKRITLLIEAGHAEVVDCPPA
jgi:hypothetical protein